MTGGRMATALTGQGRTQAPQPLQSNCSTRGWARPPVTGANRIAPVSHCSPQTLHTTPLCERQASLMWALSGQGAWSACGTPARRVNAPPGHASTQAPQKVHSPCRKLTWGNPPRAGSRICWGQALTQSAQRVQASRNSLSPSAHGGRNGECLPRTSPRKNCLRLITLNLCRTDSGDRQNVADSGGRALT